MSVNKNLGIIGMGGAGLASLYHMVNELSPTLESGDTRDSVTIHVVNEQGRDAGGWTYGVPRGGDQITTATHIDCMGFGTPDDLFKRMNKNPKEWQQYVPHRKYDPEMDCPYDPSTKGSFPPESTISYEGYRHYVDLIQKEIEEKCIVQGDSVDEVDAEENEKKKKSGTRITLNYIRGKALTLDDVSIVPNLDISQKYKTMAKKTISYIKLSKPGSKKLPDTKGDKADTKAGKVKLCDANGRAIEIDGSMVCLGNGMPDPALMFGAKIVGSDVFLNRFDDLTPEKLAGKRNDLLLGAGNASVAAIIRLKQLGYKGDILVGNINDDYPHRNLDRKQQYWKREHFTTPKIKALVKGKSSTMPPQIIGGRVVDREGKRDTDKAKEIAKTIAEEVKNELRAEFKKALKKANDYRLKEKNAIIEKTGEIPKDKEPITDMRAYAMHPDTRNTPWSKELDWRDVLDSLDRNANTGVFRDNWTSIMAELPDEVVEILTRDRDGLTKEFTGANWANSRHRTPVDHWKILDEIRDSGQLQMRSDFDLTQPIETGNNNILVHFNDHIVEVEGDAYEPLSKPLAAIAAKAQQTGGHITVAQAKAILKNAAPGLMNVYPRKDKTFDGLEDDSLITPNEVGSLLQIKPEKHETMKMENALVINCTGHTTKLALMDNAFARLMQKNCWNEQTKSRDEPACITADPVNGGVYVNRDSCPIRSDKTVDEYVRYVGACTGYLSPWNKTIMRDIIPNAGDAVKSLLKTIDLDRTQSANPPPIEPCNGTVDSRSTVSERRRMAT